MKNSFKSFPAKNGPAFIIAELSANHNNNFDLAVKTIETMARSGANAVKIQTYTADSLSLNVDNQYFGPRTEGLWKGRRPYELFQEASLPYEWQPKLKEIAEGLGLVFFSSPFDLEAVEFLEKMGVELYKVASPEITDIPLIEHIARKGKPIIFSTGLADISDIDLAITVSKNNGNEQLALLKCTSQYPAKISEANLLIIPDMLNRFGCTVGVSDHSMGSIVPVVSVSLGAKIVEKHFILDRSLGGVDSAFSMEPKEFEQMVMDVRDAESSLGVVDYTVSEKDKLRRRSIFAVADISEGEIFSNNNIRSIRPGYGLHPKFFDSIIGKKAKYSIAKGTPIVDDLIC